MMAVHFPVVFEREASGVVSAYVAGLPVYGDRNDAPQVDAIVQAIARARETKGMIAFALHAHVWPVVQGSLRAMKADIDAGIVENVERVATGGVIADMLGLAKEALSAEGDGAKNVAAVLTAASFEDAIRKMGELLANVQGRPELQSVIGSLKQGPCGRSSLDCKWLLKVPQRRSSRRLDED